MKSFIAG